MPANVNLNFLKKLRNMGIIEGSSTLLLFGIAMPLKYMAGIPLAVRIVGPLHGLLFLTLVLMSLLAIKKVPLGLAWGALSIIAAVVPFGPFLMDIKLKKLERD